MKKTINNYIANKNKGDLLGIDFHDIIELSKQGFKDNEISKELGIPKGHVDKLLKEYDRVY